MPRKTASPPVCGKCKGTPRQHAITEPVIYVNGKEYPLHSFVMS
jgi:hypothetical protein